MIISDYSNSTRFVLSCNDSTKLIDAIQSRCCILRFNRLSEKEVKNRLLEVIKIENVNYTQDGLDALTFIAEGDMRSAINNL
jgi:replication factor C subunit 2/4